MVIPVPFFSFPLEWSPLFKYQIDERSPSNFSFDLAYPYHEYPLLLFMTPTPNQPDSENLKSTLTNEEEEPLEEFVYKILVVGDLGCGKTSYIHRYVNHTFSNTYRATVSFPFPSNHQSRWFDQLFDILFIYLYITLWIILPSR